jgi:hypothetical protein
MTNFKLRATVAAISGMALLGLNGAAKADSVDALLMKLRDKGVLSQSEYDSFNSARDEEQAQKAKETATINKGKIKISDVIDSATLYGDMRARYEWRDGDDNSATQTNSENRDRGRYKISFGVKTSAEDFYTDLAFAMGAGGRSDNATFGGGNSNGQNNKETLYVKRAMVGWNVADWLTLEAGRTANPLYTTQMVWDGDLTFEGLNEQLKFKTGNADLFLTFVQSQYLGDDKNYDPRDPVTYKSAYGKYDNPNNFLLAFQGGAKYKFTDDISGKAALTYYTYTHDQVHNSSSTFVPFTPYAGTRTDSSGYNVTAINDVKIIEIPLELNFKGSGTLTYSAFGDYAHNTQGGNRKDFACEYLTANKAASKASNADIAAVCESGTDDSAWMLGVGIKSAQGKSPQKGDWNARLWWQEVGMYALDPNTPDSDFMDSRVNMKGVVFKGEYLLRDNVFVNIAAGHAERKNDKLSAAGTGDLDLNLDKFNLYQLDLTYKF